MENVIATRTNSQGALAVFYFAPALVPVILLHAGIFQYSFIPKSYHNFVMLSLVLCAVMPFAKRLQVWTQQDIGFGAADFKDALRFYVKGAFVGLLIFAIVAGIVKPIRTTIDQETIVLYSFVGSILQEFLYRGYLFKIGERLFSKRMNFCMNVCVFTFMHSIFGKTIEEKVLIMGVISVVGVYFTYLYCRYPNLILISAAHIIANTLGVYSGIFN